MIKNEYSIVKVFKCINMNQDASTYNSYYEFRELMYIMEMERKKGIDQVNDNLIGSINIANRNTKYASFKKKLLIISKMFKK